MYMNLATDSVAVCEKYPGNLLWGSIWGDNKASLDPKLCIPACPQLVTFQLPFAKLCSTEPTLSDHACDLNGKEKNASE